MVDGRFLSQDPLPQPQRYAYVNDNPANLIDPSGLFSVQDAASDVYEIAKQILNDPCWKTQIFCPHPALHWNQIKKTVKKYGWECAKGAASGAVVGLFLGAWAGAGYGAAWGCAGSMIGRGFEEEYGSWSSGNFLGQCGASAFAAGGTLLTIRGGNTGLAEYAVGSGGACAGGFLGWFTKKVMSYDPHADGSGNAVAQCSVGGLTAASLAAGRGRGSAVLLLEAGSACLSGAATEAVDAMIR